MVIYIIFWIKMPANRFSQLLRCEDVLLFFEDVTLGRCQASCTIFDIMQTKRLTNLSGPYSRNYSRMRTVVSCSSRLNLMLINNTVNHSQCIRLSIEPQYCLKFNCRIEYQKLSVTHNLHWMFSQICDLSLFFDYNQTLANFWKGLADGCFH